MTDWIRIPEPIPTEEDRRALCAILTSIGLEVRIVRAKVGTGKSPPIKRFVEYRQSTQKAPA